MSNRRILKKKLARAEVEAGAEAHSRSAEVPSAPATPAPPASILSARRPLSLPSTRFRLEDLLKGHTFGLQTVFSQHGTDTVRQQAAKLDVEMPHQKRSNWCWVAASAFCASALGREQRSWPLCKIANEALDRIVMKALARDVADRYQTAQELARDLYTFLAPYKFDKKELVEQLRSLFRADYDAEAVEVQACQQALLPSADGRDASLLMNTGSIDAVVMGEASESLQISVGSGSSVKPSRPWGGWHPSCRSIMTPRRRTTAASSPSSRCTSSTHLRRSARTRWPPATPTPAPYFCQTARLE